MRGLATVLLALSVVALLAAALVRVPETVEAGFVLVPSGGASPVRAPRTGVVAEIRAREGETLAAGAPFFVLRSESASDRSAERSSLEAQSRADQDGLASERAQWASRQRTDAEEERRLAERLSDLARMIELRKDSAQSFRKVVSLYDTLQKQGLVSDVEVMTQRVAANQAELQARELESERAQVAAALAKLSHERQERRLAHEQAERRLLESQEKARIRGDALGRQLGESADGTASVPAPCAGTVLRLAVPAPGAFVRDGEVLAELACAGRSLQAALEVPPGAVGRLEAGQAVKLLYDAFPYQRYGVRRGTLRWVAPASLEVAGRREFPALVDLAEEAIVAQGRPRPLLPGMEGRARIVVGHRSLISHALEPLRQLQESVSP
jgi:membrane fusion protein